MGNKRSGLPVDCGHVEKAGIGFNGDSCQQEFAQILRPEGAIQSYLMPSPLSWKGNFLSFPLSHGSTGVEEVQQDNATMIAKISFWPRKSWFLVLLVLLRGTFGHLPIKDDLLLQEERGFLHLSLDRVHLTTWMLKGISYPTRALFLRLAIIFLQRLDKVYNRIWQIFSSWSINVLLKTFRFLNSYNFFRMVFRQC